MTQADASTYPAVADEPRATPASSVRTSGVWDRRCASQSFGQWTSGQGIASRRMRVRRPIASHRSYR